MARAIPRNRNPRVRPEAVIHGGGHEKKMRSGTLNVPGIVGLGKACEILKKEMDEEIPRLLHLRTKLEKGVLDSLDEVHINGSLGKRHDDSSCPESQALRNPIQAFF